MLSTTGPTVLKGPTEDSHGPGPMDPWAHGLWAQGLPAINKFQRPLPAINSSLNDRRSWNRTRNLQHDSAHAPDTAFPNIAHDIQTPLAIQIKFAGKQLEWQCYLGLTVPTY